MSWDWHILGEWERVGEAQNDKISNLFLDEMQSKYSKQLCATAHQI